MEQQQQQKHQQKKSKRLQWKQSRQSTRGSTWQHIVIRRPGAHRRHRENYQRRNGDGHRLQRDQRVTFPLRLGKPVKVKLGIRRKMKPAWVSIHSFHSLLYSRYVLSMYVFFRTTLFSFHSTFHQFANNLLWLTLLAEVVINCHQDNCQVE